VVTFAVVYKVAGGERRSIPVAVSEGK